MNQILTFGRIAPIINTAMLTAVIGLAGTLLALFVKYRLEMRKLTITENSGLRKEFLEEMHLLREEVKSLRSENMLLREEVRSLHNIIDGMRRQGMAEAFSIGRTMLDAFPQEGVPDSIRDAAVRAEQAIRGGEIKSGRALP